MSCFIAAMVIDNREWRWSIFENLLVNVLLRIVTVMPPLHSSSMDVLGGSGLRIDFLLSNLISKFQWLADHDSGEVGDMGRGLGSQQGLYATRIE
ncbi:hypothetical protein V6N13_097539 [Hibiscus sabdariffa]